MCIRDRSTAPRERLSKCFLLAYTTLRQWRIGLTDAFAGKAAASARFSHWFPLRAGARAASRSEEKYLETFAQCDRLRYSPVHYMRRRLNGKLGKEYGERNRCYRDTEPDGIHRKRGAGSTGEDVVPAVKKRRTVH